MFTFEVIILAILAFFLGSVFNTLLLSRMYEDKATEEEIKSTTNRGDQSNGLSVIKNISTKRFYRSIASLILIVVIITVFILSYQFDLFDKWIALVVLGVFAFYVLTIEKTIILVHIPVFEAWKEGAPKRKISKENRKSKKLKKVNNKLMEKELEIMAVEPEFKPVVASQPVNKKTVMLKAEIVDDKEEV